MGGHLLHHVVHFETIACRQVAPRLGSKQKNGFGLEPDPFARLKPRAPAD